MTPKTDVVEAYLSRFRRALGDAQAEERDEIVSDIRCLIQERIATGSEPVEAVLDRLGAPEALADAYRVEGLLSRAAHTSAPLALLRAVGRWAVGGLLGFITATVVFLGYLFGASFLGVAVMKVFLPGPIGFWVGPGTFLFGRVNPATPGVHEVLGPFFIPVCVLLALAFFVLTTRLARWLIRRRSPLNPFQSR